MIIITLPCLYGTDSTSVVEITSLVVEDNGDILGDSQLYEEAVDFIEKVSQDEKLSISERLKNGEDILNRFNAQANRAEHRVGATICDYRILEGKLLNRQKELILAINGKWETYAATAHKSIGERSRQQYMLMAKRTDVHPYTFLGKERLLHLINATKGMNGTDPAGTLLREFNIEFNSEAEVSIESFKSDVDAAIAVVKARKADLTLDFERVRKLVEIGDVPDNKMIRDLAMIERNGGDINGYLDRRFANQGEEEEILHPQQRLERFERLASKMKSTIAIIMKHAYMAGMIDKGQVEALESKIAELKVFITRS